MAEVQGVLKALNPAQQWNLLGVVPEGNQWDSLPVVPLGPPARLCHSEISAVFPQFCIRPQTVTVPNIAVQAVLPVQLHPLHHFLAIPLPNLLAVVPQGAVQNGVLVVRPKGENLKGREPLQAELPLFVVVGVKPAHGSTEGIFSQPVEHPGKAFPQSIPKFGDILLVLPVDGQGFSQKVVYLLIRQLGILVVHQAVVGEIFHRLKAAVRPDHPPFPLQDILIPPIVAVPQKLLFPQRGFQPGVQLQGKKFQVGQALPALFNDAIDSLCLCVRRRQ